MRGTALEPPARPLDAATRGKAAHALLERLYRLEPCSRGLGHIDADQLRELFRGLIGTVLDDVLTAGDPFQDALRGLETERLGALVLTLRALELDRPGFRVRTEVAQDVQIGPLALGVRLDRVDSLDAGGEVVIDYKTGAFDPGAWKRPRVPDSQLPLYAVTGGFRGVAVIQLRPPGARLRGVGDEGLAIDGLKPSAAFFGEPGLDWPATSAAGASNSGSSPPNLPGVTFA